MSPAAAPARQPSLRSRMSWRVLLPLAATWSIGTAVAIYLAWVLADRAADRALLDNAYAIAAHVSARPDGTLAVDLSPQEIETVLFDRVERQLVSVRAADGALVAGNADLRAPSGVPSGGFYDGGAADEPLRLAVLRSDTSPLFAVVVGQTTRTRSDLLRSLVERALLPQLALLILLGLYLRWQIGRELAPVDRLQRQLGLRRSGELAPIELDARSADVARLRDAVNGLLARIADGVRAQREFAGNVAHDLRTPLAGIRALAEYGLAQRDPAAWREQLQRIVASEERATRLVEQLLALAMADEARDGVRLEPVAVDAVVRRVLLGSMARADAAGVDLGAAGIDAPVLAQASPVLLEGVVANLVDNALRYGRGAAAPEVTVAVDGGRKDIVSIVVADNGPGLDAAQRDALSQRWARGDAGAALGTGSSGLGLSIVSRYVELMAGTLRLESGDGGVGLRVVVTLPAA